MFGLGRPDRSSSGGHRRRRGGCHLRRREPSDEVRGRTGPSRSRARRVCRSSDGYRCPRPPRSRRATRRPGSRSPEPWARRCLGSRPAPRSRCCRRLLTRAHRRALPRRCRRRVARRHDDRPSDGARGTAPVPSPHQLQLKPWMSRLSGDRNTDEAVDPLIAMPTMHRGSGAPPSLPSTAHRQSCVSCGMNRDYSAGLPGALTPRSDHRGRQQHRPGPLEGSFRSDCEMKPAGNGSGRGLPQRQRFELRAAANRP